MPTPKKITKPVSKKTKGPEPKKIKASSNLSLGNGLKGTKAQQDSSMMSRGMTPKGDSYYFPKSQSEKKSNQAKAAKSNPAKTGKSPRY